MASRLLETGSTPLIRNTAAQQLADVQKAHPEELFNLLTRVVPYLRHKTWDTRTAASKPWLGLLTMQQSMTRMVSTSQRKMWRRKEESGIKKEEVVEPVPLAEGQLSLDTLDIVSILKYGKELVRGEIEVMIGLSLL
ncbi:hypothetical protein DID88_001579 [Monilinia fructigena]|uniref:Uncharacterized protein n=1 Tax=Monilinia fructigena TaxID=38457 RepID=A0A395J2V6_9HELO|nr:hypothetical protein DID88_001579 [Monilinia fructigena]